MKRLLVLLVLSFSLVACVTTYERDEKSTPTASDLPHTRDDPNIIRISNGEWAPFSGENLPGNGCDSQIISEVFNRMGYTVEYEFFPWARAMALAQNGEFDGTVEWDDTPEWRKSFYINKEAISPQEWVFFHRKNIPFHWETIQDLAGKKIGITAGYIYSNAFSLNNGEIELHFEEASSDEANFKKLIAGRIDIFPMERSVGEFLLKEKFNQQETELITYHPKPLAAFKPRLLLNRKIPENELLIAQFDETLEQYRETPEYRDILDTCLR